MDAKEDYELDVSDRVHSSSQRDHSSRDTNKIPKHTIRGGLTIVITSSMKDIAIFVRDNPSLFQAKTREVVVMGGCKPVNIESSKTALAMASTLKSSMQSVNIWSKLSEIECEPDSAHNNTFDCSASKFFYSRCQQMNVTLTVVSRHAGKSSMILFTLSALTFNSPVAYAAKMPRSVYDDLALTGSPIGWRLRNSQRASIDQLWQRACSKDPAARCGLPFRCDRKWFISELNDYFCLRCLRETQLCLHLSFRYFLRRKRRSVTLLRGYCVSSVASGSQTDGLSAPDRSFSTIYFSSAVGIS